MKLRLPILSVLTLWWLLGVLAVGLLNILKPLERVRRSMESIAMGVRAIEQETSPLTGYATTLLTALPAVADGATAIASGLTAIDRDLDAVAPLLKPGA